MDIKKAVGKGASTRKYDLLTVLSAYALSGDKHLQRLVLRFSCLITARYNWQTNQLSIAQTEIAKLWACDPRTVKRDMAALRAKGWLVERQAAARGRATVYGLGVEQILMDTESVWDNVGRDLRARLTGRAEEAPAANVIPFPQAPAPAADGSLWAQVAERLHAEDPAVFQAWFAGLRAEEQGGDLLLRAQGGFHANYINTHLRGRIERHLASLAPTCRLICA